MRVILAVGYYAHEKMCFFLKMNVCSFFYTYIYSHYAYSNNNNKNMIWKWIRLKNAFDQNENVIRSNRVMPLEPNGLFFIDKSTENV